ncbi:hypothetical protein [Pseudomonas sp. NPDC087817]|uniref:hypothetical protein n=1 Tax=Pseudomonas sp. NPDC087817 TaxID=3364451 RepID=UPI0038134F86
MADTLAALNLPNAVEVQTLKLLNQIALAHTADDLFRASDRAEGFVLGLEAVKVLNAASIEGLYRLSKQPPRRGVRSTNFDRRRHSRGSVANSDRAARYGRLSVEADCFRANLGQGQIVGRNRPRYAINQWVSLLIYWPEAVCADVGRGSNPYPSSWP